MTSNPFFSKGRKADQRRELTWPAIYGIIFFLLIPVAYLIGLNGVLRTNGSGLTDAEQIAYLRRALQSYLANTMGMSSPTFALCAAGFLEAYHQFGFLHRGRETDFFHSLPQTRRQIYSARYVNGVLSVLLPYILALVIGEAAALFSGLTVGESAPMLLTAAGLNSLIFLLTYGLAILAVMLTGKPLTGVLGMGVLYLYFPALAMVVEAIPGTWFSTFAGYEKTPAVLRILEELSPVSQTIAYAGTFRGIFRFADAYTYNTVSLGSFLIRVACGVAAAVLLMIAGCLLYERRALEKAGEGMAFAATERPIRIAITAFAALFGLQFISEFGDGRGWALFGTALAVLLAHFAVELIYRADVKRILKHPVELGIVLGAAVLFALAMTGDWFGYDRYLPETEKTAGVRIEISGTEYANRGIFSGIEEEISLYRAEFDVDAVADGRERLCITDPAAREAVRRVAVDGISHTAGSRKQASVYTVNSMLAGNEGKDPENTRQATVTWYLRSGKTVKRSYSVSAEVLEEAYGILCADPTFKASLYPVLSLEKKDVEKAACMVYDKNLGILPEELTARVFDAVQMETGAMNSRKGEMPEAEILLFLTNECLARAGGIRNETIMPEKTGGTIMQEKNREGGFYIRVPVYPGFAETKRLLAEAGMDIASVQPFGDTDRLYYEFYNGEEYREGVLTDPEAIGALREAAYFTRYGEYDPFAETESRININASWRGGYLWVIPVDRETPELDGYLQ